MNPICVCVNAKDLLYIEECKYEFLGDFVVFLDESGVWIQTRHDQFLDTIICGCINTFYNCVFWVYDIIYQVFKYFYKTNIWKFCILLHIRCIIAYIELYFGLKIYNISFWL